MTLPAGPPENVEAADLWTRLTTMPRPHTLVPFPRKGPDGKPFTDQIAIWVLTEAELMSCRAAADAYAKLLLRNPQKHGDANIAYGEIYRNACVVEVIHRACRSTLEANLALPAFPNPERMRKFMTSDELAVLFTAYVTWQAESGPVLASMTKEEMDAWIDRLAEGATAIPLGVLSSEAKNQLLLHLVSRLRASQTGNGSPGWPHDASSTSTDPQSQSNPEDSGSPSHKPAPSSKTDPWRVQVGDDERPPEVNEDETS